MSECTCGEEFRTAEDYRDHLPCAGTKQERQARAKVLNLELENARLQLENTQILEQNDKLICDLVMIAAEIGTGAPATYDKVMERIKELREIEARMEGLKK